MTRALRTAGVWAPPLIMMAAIFALSAMPSDPGDRGLLYFLARKVAHFGEYALLMASWWWALRSRLSPGATLGLAFALTVGYAVTDEIHQVYVQGRVGTPRDVFIDSLGAAAAAALILRSGMATRPRAAGA